MAIKSNTVVALSQTKIDASRLPKVEVPPAKKVFYVARLSTSNLLGQPWPEGVTVESIRIN